MVYDEAFDKTLISSYVQTELQNMQPTKDAGCSNYRDYIPYQPDYTPVKRIRLVVHSFAKADNTGNFTGRTWAEQDFYNRMFHHMACHYQFPEKLNPIAENQPYQYITDTKVRFVIDTFLYHYNDSDWDFRSHSIDISGKDTTFSNWGSQDWSEYLYRKYVTNNTALGSREKDSSLHIFLVEAKGFDNRGMAATLATKRWVYLIGAFKEFNEDSTHSIHWRPGNLMAHEVGHALGLFHPYDGSNACFDLPYSQKGKTNNNMDTYPGQGSAFTPGQIGLLHYYLSGNSGDVGDAVIRDWRTYHPDSIMFIKAGDTVVFNSGKFLWGDLVLQPNAVLVVKCNLIMPPNSEILVKKGATLIVDGATISTEKGLVWKGVHIVKSKKKLFKKAKPLGRILSLNGGKLAGLPDF